MRNPENENIWTIWILFFRLFHSILNLRQVMQSSAHWLLLLDKSQYYHDQSKPFLLMVQFIVILLL